MALAKGASPQDVATYLYKAIENDDYEAFKEDSFFGVVTVFILSLVF